jgi:hypothetical protein
LLAGKTVFSILFRAFLSNDVTVTAVFERPKGPTRDAIIQEPGVQLIPKVDVGKAGSYYLKTQDLTEPRSYLFIFLKVSLSCSGIILR